MRNTFRLGALATALALAGCSTVNPYQRQGELDADLSGLAGPARPAGGPKPAMAGGLGEALLDINAQRVAWFESLSTHAKVANAASLSVYGISAWGLYQGLKPNFGAAGVASESTRANLAKAGIGAGLSYAIGNLFLNDKHDEAYVGGFKALTCLMARARPYLLKQQDELEDLKQQANRLETALLAADQEALRLRWAHGVVPSTKSGATPLARALSSSQTAQKQGRLTLERARMLVSRVETVGFQLRRQGDLVVASVSEELRRNNKGVASPEEFLTQLQAVTGRFQAIAPVESADDAADDPDPKQDTETRPPQAPDAQPAPQAGPSPAAGAPAAPKPPAADAALAALAARVEELRSAILKPEARKDQAFKQLDEQTQKLKKQLDAAEADIRRLKQAAAAPPPPSVTLVARDQTQDDAKGKLLADQVAQLYAQRRKVNQYLVNHNDLAGRVKNIPECRAGSRPTMMVLPGEDRTVSPGSYRFVISGAKGVPLVSVDGNAGSPPADKRTLTVTLEGGTVLVDLLVADGASGALRLLVHDPVSKATEDLVLTVVPAKKS